MGSGLPRVWFFSAQFAAMLTTLALVNFSLVHHFSAVREVSLAE